MGDIQVNMTVPDIPEDIQAMIVPDMPEYIQANMNASHIPEDIQANMIVPDMPEYIHANMTVSDIPEDIQANMIVPDILEDIQVNIIVPDIPQDIQANMTVPDIPEDIQTNMTVPEIPEDIQANMTVPDIPDDIQANMIVSAVLKYIQANIIVPDIPEDIQEELIYSYKTSISEMDLKDLTKVDSYSTLNKIKTSENQSGITKQFYSCSLDTEKGKPTVNSLSETPTSDTGASPINYNCNNYSRDYEWKTLSQMHTDVLNKVKDGKMEAAWDRIDTQCKNNETELSKFNLLLSIILENEVNSLEDMVTKNLCLAKRLLEGQRSNVVVPNSNLNLVNSFRKETEEKKF